MIKLYIYNMLAEHCSETIWATLSDNIHLKFSHIFIHLWWKHILAAFGFSFSWDCFISTECSPPNPSPEIVLWLFLPFLGKEERRKKNSIFCHYHKFIQFKIISITRKAAQRAINFSKAEHKAVEMRNHCLLFKESFA